ncbi:Conserved_hypothetical protein [Hexamita inflata]|uniref:Uncharacterized protein n=1 Tax=Hexamita inflata TaxID=28002 RepID=A0ABP1HP26_9EUKA
MQNGVCVCSTTNAFVQNNICTCGVNAFNTSNTCSCPTGASLQSGVCVCNNVNAYISGSSCVCPTYSSLVGNVCTCPANSNIVNNICTCNTILYQIMQSGVCVCSTTNAFVLNSACTCGTYGLNISNICSCPANSQLEGGVCTCNINQGQIMQNGVCVCSTTNAFVQNNICTCGVNAFNTSNTCSCPTGASLQSGVCVCNNVNAYISGSSCVCPTYSSLVGNVCTCPANSIIVNNICTCNTILYQIMQSGVCVCSTTNAFVLNSACTCGTYGLNISNICSCPANSQLEGGVCTCNINQGQIMQNGVCVCSTTNAFVQNNICTCGVNAFNTSNTCSCPTGASLQSGVCVCNNVNAYISGSSCVCPTYSSLVGNVCTCPANSIIIQNTCSCGVITGQIMVNGSCQCKSGQLVVNNSCFSNMSIYDLSSSYMCSQLTIVVNFNVLQVTNTISNATEWNGYIFSVEQIIQNAFINITSNVYKNQPSIQPLFQNQSIFTNIQIQIGSSEFPSGTILTYCNTLTINQMNITSLYYSTITTEYMNILTSSSSNSVIKNLIIQFQFSYASIGNITLINQIQNSLTLTYCTNYVILGQYCTSNQIALIALISLQCTLTVNGVNFMVSSFLVGNYSAYLLMQVQNSSLNINNVAIQYGDYQKELITRISPIDSFQFGGLITFTNNSNIIITNYISNTNIDFNISSDIDYSGLIIGVSKLTKIQISLVCIKYQITVQQLVISHGLIGQIVSGNLSFQSGNIIMNVIAKNIGLFGIIGNLMSNYSQIKNIETQLMSNISLKTYSYASTVIGNTNSICDISNILVNPSNFSAASEVGGVIGYCDNVTNMNNISIQQLNISSSYSGGGIIGAVVNTSITLKNSVVQSIFIKVTQNRNESGIILGYDFGKSTVQSIPFSTFTIQNCSSSGTSYINNVLQSNCAILNNALLQQGC